MELSLEFRILALQSTEMFSKSLFGLPSSNGCLKIVEVDDCADSDIEAWSIIFDGTP
jgi:hypothetical protein